MTLGRKDLHDQDHGVNISPLKAKKRCRCSLIIKNMRVLRRTETENECSSTLVENLEYNCDEAGEFYCNEVRVTGWFIADDNNANSGSAFPCEPRNITKMIYETDVSSIGTVDWSAWPLVIPANPFPVFNP